MSAPAITRLLGAALLALGGAAGALAHDGEDHGSSAEALAHLNAAPLPEGEASRFPTELGGAFSLTDQYGRTRTEADPEGRLQLLFFGYANCPGICSVALPRMAEMVGLAAEAGIDVAPLMVTIDPEHDTVGTMGAPLAEIDPALVGLTGTEEELAQVRALFQVEKKFIFEDPEYGPIFAHGSFIYLLDPEGGLLTLIPPILGPERGAEIIARYAPLALAGAEAPVSQ